MTAIQLATKATASPLAEAEAEQESARAEAADITAKISALKRSGAGVDVDQAVLAGLEAAQEVALKRLRHADLNAEELKAAGAAPISARVLGKIRVMRRRVADLHPSLMTRMNEKNYLRSRQQGLRNSIEEIKDSAEYRHDQRELLRVFGGKIDGKVDTSRSGKTLARLERDLTQTSAEVEIAATAQVEAQAKWQGSKATLDKWERAIRASGPAAARALAELPAAGASVDLGLNPGAADIEVGHGAFSTRAMTQ